MGEVIPHLSYEVATILVHVSTKSVSLVIFPVAIVDFTIGVRELSQSTSFIFLPFTCVRRPISPCLSSETVPEWTDPFAFVNRAGLELVLRPLLSFVWLLWIARVLLHLHFHHFLQGEIL